MTYPQYPQPFQPPRPPAKPGGGPKPLVIIAAAIGGLCMVGILIGAIGAVLDSGGTSTTTTKAAAAAAVTIRPTTTTPPAPVYDIPAHHNIAPELTVTGKKCYGSAGCNFDYELRVVTTAPVDFAPTKRYRVTVALDEGTSWERIHSITITGTKANVITGLVSSDTNTTPVATIQSITAL
ncbi:hypothetical protein ACFWU5_10650 [Nocardia sp. NPDC058640]|uniref:hypothetical protein n=1 Tax=Nocardia sp. NPDC058640 TaxID=3346571 RepID=UPI00366696C9